MLDNVSFVSGVDFSSVCLPKKGIRVFNNAGGDFTNALFKKKTELDEENFIPLEVLAEVSKDQEIEVVDILTLNHLFSKRPLGLEAFEKIASEFEMPNQPLQGTY
ncbi:MAG: hypothetical protein OEV42_10325 [Deltaproteobacteria bacterium]|nr:hypothetical protein [Deltaproteobacteria bacterium]